MSKPYPEDQVDEQKTLKAKILFILTNNLSIDKSGFSGELQIAGIWKTAEKIAELVKKEKKNG